MSLPVTFRWQAKQDLDEAVEWYERQRVGLGRRFQNRVEEVLERISRSPETHGRVYRDVRCANVRRFPYGVYYRVEPDSLVVVAVFHARRDPRAWQRRV